MRDTDELGMHATKAGTVYTFGASLISRELQWSDELSDIITQTNCAYGYARVILYVYGCLVRGALTQIGSIRIMRMFVVFSLCFYDEEVRYLGRNNKYV